MKKIFIIYLIVNCFSIVISQNNFSLSDLNPSSDTYGQTNGQSYLSNNIIVIGFFNEY